MTLMKKLPLLTLLFAILFVTPLVLADYNFYFTKGNNGAMNRNIGGTGTNTYTYIEPSTSNKGSYAEPLVADMNGDGVNEIILSTGNTSIGVYEGNNVNAPFEEVDLGGMTQSHPVMCDLNNDGKKEYVTLTSNNTHYLLSAFTFTTTSGLQLLASKVIDNLTTTPPVPTIYGNIVCDNFYIKQGDTANYIFFVDNNKYLHQLKRNGATFTETIEDSYAVPSNNLFGAEDAHTLETQNGAYTFGSNDLALDTNLDPNGNHALIYTAGNYSIVVTSDIPLAANPTRPAYDHTADYANAYSLAKPEKITVQSGFGSAGKNYFVVAPTGFYTNAASSGHQVLVVMKMTKNIFGARGLSQQTILNTPPSTETGVCANGKSSQDIVFGKYKGDDVAFILLKSGDEPPCNSLVMNAGMVIQILYANGTHTKIVKDSGLDGSLGSPFSTISLIGFTGTISKDLLYYTGEEIRLADASTNYTTDYSIYNFTTPSTNPAATYAPTAVDYNKDGLLDVVYSSPNRTFFLQSSTVGVIAQQYPFTIALNNTGNKNSVVRVTAGFNNSGGADYFYNYAVSCDLSDATLYNEQFKFGYNFSTNNVSTSVFNPEAFLTGFSMNFNINDTYPQFDLLKTGNEALRDYAKVRVTYNAVGNLSLDVISFAGDTQLTSYWRFNKTGNTVIISKVVVGQGEVNFANTTITNGYFDLNIVYSPLTDSGTGQQYFNAEFFNGNVSIATTSTAQFDGSTIKDVELFSSTNGTTIQLQRLGLFKTHKPYPQFVGFQNMQLLSSQGVSIFVPAPSEYIVGDGFTVKTGALTNDQAVGIAAQLPKLLNGITTLDLAIAQVNPVFNYFLNKQILANADSIDTTYAFDTIVTRTVGGNNVFYGVCEYNEAGTYTQRHFITPSTTQTWDNYKDITVTVTNGTTTTTTSQTTVPDTCIGGADCVNGVCTGSRCTFTGDTFQDGIFSFLSFLGFKSAASRLFFWLFVSVFITILFGMLFANLTNNATAGTIVALVSFIGMFAVGTMIGLVPLWLVVVLFLVSAGIVSWFVTRLSGG